MSRFRRDEEYESPYEVDDRLCIRDYAFDYDNEDPVEDWASVKDQEPPVILKMADIDIS